MAVYLNKNLMKSLEISTITRWIFWISIFLLLTPIWTNQYFLTSDGPNHLYNVKVWWNIMQREHYSFFFRYMYLNEHIEPNYFGHFVMGLLMQFLSPFTAEKLLLSGYIILFPVSFRFLIRQIRPQNDWLVFLALPFVYNHVFQMGFYNFSYSLIFGFFLIGLWLKWQDDFSDSRKLRFALVALLCFFSHPVGLLVSLSTIGVLFLAYNWQDYKKLRQRLVEIILPLVPVILLMLEFIYRKPGASAGGKEPFSHLFSEFIQLTGLVALKISERPITQGLAILFAVLLLLALVKWYNRRVIDKMDAFFAVFLFWLLLYLNLPGGVAGGGITGIRIQFIPYLLLLFWLATLDWNSYIKWGLTGVGTVVALLLLAIRLPTYQKLSAAVSEIRTAAAYIEDEKTVLNLTYAFNGKSPDGKLIADANWLFLHAGDYLAIDRYAIMLPNYEAGTYNFPLIWRWQVEPFSQIGNLEGIPPQANFLDYPQRTGGQLDYVVTCWLDDQWKDHPEALRVLDQLNQGYELIFTSPHGMVKLYRRKI